MRFDGWFRLASHLKQSLNELMGWDGPLTHRQFLAWQWWLAEEWNRPNRSDHYAMQTASAMEGALGGQQRQLTEWKIKFGVTSSSQEAAAGAGYIKEEPTFMVDGKPFGPRRLTKADIERMEQQNLFARVAAVKPDRSKLTQEEMSRQIKEVERHNEQARQQQNTHRITPNGVKPN